MTTLANLFKRTSTTLQSSRTENGFPSLSTCLSALQGEVRGLLSSNHHSHLLSL